MGAQLAPPSSTQVLSLCQKGARTVIEGYAGSMTSATPSPDADRLQFVTRKSESLGGRGDITLFVPPAEGGPLPLVILLNGVYGSHRAWYEQGDAHHTALRLIGDGRIRPMVLAMPADGLWTLGTGFVRHVDGAYEHWIMEDVIGAQPFPLREFVLLGCPTDWSRDGLRRLRSRLLSRCGGTRNAFGTSRSVGCKRSRSSN